MPLHPVHTCPFIPYTHIRPGKIISREPGSTSTWKLNTFSRTFRGFQKPLWEYSWSAKGEKTCSTRFCDLKYAHPGILAFLERSEFKPSKWHLSDPELIPEALKCKKMLRTNVFILLHNVAQRWYQNIIVDLHCVGWLG